MTARAPLTIAVAVVALLACAGAQRQARLREQLDAYSIPKPLAEVWPEALRYVSEHGFDLVGKDRLVLGQSEQGSIGKFFSTGHETQAISSTRQEAETAGNVERKRYRITGIQTGAASCRIEFRSVTSGDPLRGSEMNAPDREFRDVQLEVDFLERYDAGAAERMVAAAAGQR